MSSMRKLDEITKLKRLVSVSTLWNQEITSCIDTLIVDNKQNEIIDFITKYSDENCYIANRALIVQILAYCCRTNQDIVLRKEAFKLLPIVCKSSPYFFLFIKFVTCNPPITIPNNEGANTVNCKNFGRMKKKAIARWYNDKTGLELAAEVTRYQSRLKWSHSDLIKLAHVKASNEANNLVLKYIVKKKKVFWDSIVESNLSEESKRVVSYLKAVEEAKHCRDEMRLQSLIDEHKLQFEQIPNFLMPSSVQIWRKLINTLPLNLLLLNLKKIAPLHLLQHSDSGLASLLERLNNQSDIQQRKIHPIEAITAWKDYMYGKSKHLSWIPNVLVIKALEDLFYKTLSVFQRTGKKLLLSINTMDLLTSIRIAGTHNLFFPDAVVSAALCLIRNEPNCHLFPLAEATMGELDLDQEITVDKLVLHWNNLVDHRDMCTADMTPIKWATVQKVKFDVFILFSYTHSIQLFESINQELKTYRDNVNQPNAKLILVSFDKQPVMRIPEDPYSLFLDGLVPSTPDIIYSFISSNLDPPKSSN